MSKSISPTVPAAVAPAALAGVITEGVLYGFVVFLTVASQYSLLFRPRASRNIPLTIASILLFGLATAHFAVDIVAVFKAYAILDQAKRLSTLANATSKLNMTKVVLYDISMVIGDAVVIYRAWIVFGQNILVVLPAIILSVASAIIEFLTVYAGFQPTTELSRNLFKKIQDYGTEGFVLSLVASLYATFLIAFKIWRYEYKGNTEFGSQQYQRRSLLPVAIILIESGVLNAAFLITYIGVLVSTRRPGNRAIVADMIIIDIASSVVAIVFSMVIVQVALRSREQEKWLANSSISSKSIVWRWPGSNATDSRGQTQSTLPPAVTGDEQLTAMQLELTERHSESSSGRRVKGSDDAEKNREMV